VGGAGWNGHGGTADGVLQELPDFLEFVRALIQDVLRRARGRVPDRHDLGLWFRVKSNYFTEM